MINDQHSHAHGEAGFSIIEVVIAALLLAVVVVGATAMFGSASHSSSTVKVRDKQVALANQVLTKLQSDPSWSTWCRAQTNPFDCNLSRWMSDSTRRYDQLGRVTDGGGTTLDFSFVVKAIGTDLPADGLNGADKDGLRPDVYRLSISISPGSDVNRRFPDMKAYSVQAEYNPSVRVTEGRVSIDVCQTLNQVDERMPIADCAATGTVMPQLPPPSLDTTNNTTIRRTCDGPSSSMVGSDERDCIAFKCANKAIASRNPGLRTPCSSFPGWEDPSSWGGYEGFFTTVVTKPAVGSIRLRNVKSGRVYGPVQLNGSGRANFTKMPIGEYQVLPSISGSNRLWKSKSVPSTQRVSVEEGINSRAVLVFRPNPTGRVTVPVRSVDGSIPWALRPLTGWVSIDRSGNVQQSNSPVEICLVPVPQGRLAKEDIPCQRFAQRSSTTAFNFTGVEPGLYSAQLSLNGYQSFISMNGTAGFIWVPEGGQQITKLNNSSATFEFVNGLCAKYVRQRVVGTTFDPVNRRSIPPVQPCNSPGGPSGPGGSGGGGTQ
jgi:hypothetical protein